MGLASSFAVLPSQLLENCMSRICSQAKPGNASSSWGAVGSGSGASACPVEHVGKGPRTSVCGDPASQGPGHGTAALFGGAVDASGEGTHGGLPGVPGAPEAAALADADVETLAELAGVLLQPLDRSTGGKRKRGSAGSSQQEAALWSFPPQLVRPSYCCLIPCLTSAPFTHPPCFPVLLLKSRCVLCGTNPQNARGEVSSCKPPCVRTYTLAERHTDQHQLWCSYLPALLLLPFHFLLSMHCKNVRKV